MNGGTRSLCTVEELRSDLSSSPVSPSTSFILDVFNFIDLMAVIELFSWSLSSLLDVLLNLDIN